MKILFASLIFLLGTSAANADDGKSSNFSMMLGSLSSMLSSTNPTATYNDNAPKSGEAPTPDTSTTTRLSQLPPLVPEPQPVITPVPRGAPSMVPIDSMNEEAIKLSPETRKMLEMTPSNIGGAKRQLSSKLQIMHGQFENDGTVAAPDNQQTAAAPPAPAKPKFEISVQNTVDAESNEELLDKALTALKVGQYESSVALYKIVLQHDPKNRDALFGIATAYHKSGQRQLAKDAYARLMAKYPDFKDGLNNVLLFASEEAPDDALAELDNLSKKDSHFAPIFAQKATIYYKKGDNDNAAKNLIKALSLDPENVLYQYNLATCYDRGGDNPDAVKLYNHLIELSYNGQKLPVSREALVERAEYLGSQKLSQTAMR